jgi:hypothetical protein
MQPECFPAHADFPKCRRPDGRGWSLTRGRGYVVTHDLCPECGGCFDCSNGCTDDPWSVIEFAARKLLDTLPIGVSPRGMTMWPKSFHIDFRDDDICYHIELTAHIQRPPKRGGTARDECTAKG